MHFLFVTHHVNFFLFNALFEMHSTVKPRKTEQYILFQVLSCGPLHSFLSPKEELNRVS